MAVLVTGGAGYIGSHTVLELVDSNISCIVVDNLSNAKLEALARVERLTGKTIPFYRTDVADKKALDKIFKAHTDITAVIHFAGCKAVVESLVDPIKYYYNNVATTITLLNSMKKAGVKELVYSSTASVYKLDSPALDENSPIDAANPYGVSKAMAEKIIIDFSTANSDFSTVLLRYFNAAGAHSSGQIGEDPTGYVHNLMPYITQVAVGARPYLNIFGNDYNTPDGTCVRDLMHVVDLAKAHIAALKALKDACGVKVYNLGSAKPVSVLEIVNTFMSVNNVKVPYSIAPRRNGDGASYYTISDKAQNELGFKANLTLADICRDHYKWQLANPKGY